MPTRVPVPPHLPQMAHQTSPEHPWPLRLLSAKVREYVEAMSRLWVEGEVMTLQRRPGAKVQFLTLRDTEEQVSMTVKIMSHLLPPTVSSGSRIVVWAKPDFYPGNGSLSLWAQEIRPVGTGDILARIEALKARLQAEGLFAPERKKPLPFLPRSIGLIVGRNTKAKEDVIVNATLRWPGVHFTIREVQVQGTAAVSQMIPALQELDSLPYVDVIILARGGGSVEDLLPFSEEPLLRAIAATNTPVVSAIGHEGDNPISDYVADLRASTPTDAAKKVVPDMREELALITTSLERMRRALASRIAREQTTLSALTSHPVLANPQTMVNMRRQDLESLRLWMHTHMRRALSQETASLHSSLSQLRALSPKATLERGYSILLDSSRHVLSDSRHTHIGESLTAVLARGTLELETKGLTHG